MGWKKYHIVSTQDASNGLVMRMPHPPPIHCLGSPLDVI